jgi:hypothetical protein
MAQLSIEADEYGQWTGGKPTETLGGIFSRVMNKIGGMLKGGIKLPEIDISGIKLPEAKTDIGSFFKSYGIVFAVVIVIIVIVMSGRR